MKWLDPHLLPGSPAIDTVSLEAAPAMDCDSCPRDSRPGIGACEWR